MGTSERHVIDHSRVCLCMKMGSVLEWDGGVIDGRFLSGCGASENIFIMRRQFCDWSFSSPLPSFLGVLTYMDGWMDGILALALTHRH